MKIFIGWSKPRSKTMAEALRTWLPFIVPCAPWVSSHDIRAGTRWNYELTKQLELTQFGIICLTRENLVIPNNWLLFEAGALSKFVDNTNLVPYLFDVQPTEIEGPLGQFHACRADKNGTWELVKSINNSLSDNKMADIIIETHFNDTWPKLENDIKSISKMREEIARNGQQIKGDILEIGDVYKQNLELKDMISKILDRIGISQTSSSDEFVINQKMVSRDDLDILEGVWQNPESATTICMQVINGQLHAPYCYGGNDRLTGIYGEWKKVGDYWYTKFRWFTRNLSGFGLYKLVSDKELRGTWWYNEDWMEEFLEKPEERHPGGVFAQWNKINSNMPIWASEYFEMVRKGEI